MKSAPYSSLELLENRIAPAGVVTAKVEAGVLTITGDDLANEVSLTVLALGLFQLTGDATNIAYDGGTAAASVSFDDLFTSVVINGGAGNDEFTLGGLLLTKTLTFNGGDGSDTISIINSQVRGTTNLLGGTASGGVNTFSFSGNNRFALLHIEGGAGVDTVILGGTSLQTGKLEILGGAGVDTVNGTATLLEAASLLVDGGTQDSNISLAGFSSVLIPGAVKLVQGDHAGTSVVNLGASYLEIGSLQIDLGGATGSTNNSVLGLSNGVILVKGAATVNGGAGNDAFGFNGLSVTTGAVKVTAKDGANTFTTNTNLQNLQAASVSYIGGVNADTISFLGGDLRTKGAFSVDLGTGAGSNTLNISSRSFFAGSVKITGGAAADDVNLNPVNFLSVKGGITATLGAGNDQFDVSGARLDAGSVTVTMASTAANTVNASIISSAVNLGAIKITTGLGSSSSFFSLGGGTVKSFAYTGDAGGDAITFNGTALRGGALTANLGDGTNSFTLGADDAEFASLSINGGTGTDTLALNGRYSIKGATNLLLGAGNSNVTIGGTGLGAILQGGLKLVASGDATTTDSFLARNLALGKAANITLGAGVSTVTIDNLNSIAAVTLSTGAGADVVNIERDATRLGISRILNKLTVDLGDGDDTIAIGRDTANEKLQALAVIIKGGAGTDTATNDIDNDNDITLPLQLSDVENQP